MEVEALYGTLHGRYGLRECGPNAGDRQGRMGGGAYLPAMEGRDGSSAACPRTGHSRAKGISSMWVKCGSMQLHRTRGPQRAGHGLAVVSCPVQRCHPSPCAHSPCAQGCCSSGCTPFRAHPLGAVAVLGVPRACGQAGQWVHELLPNPQQIPALSRVEASLTSNRFTMPAHSVRHSTAAVDPSPACLPARWIQPTG